MDCGKLFINGAEQYHYDCQRTQEKTIVLHEEEYFVLGDNRNSCIDSRLWGVVPKSDIKATALFCYFPFSKLRLF